MRLQGQVRFCACGTRLASDNPGVRCGPCQRGRAYGLGGAPVVPVEFWVSDRMSAALASRHMGNVIYAFRTDPWHGGRPGTFSFLPETLDFYEATGAVALGRPAIAINAADRALLSGQPTTYRTLTRLTRASALAQSGEIDEACRVATGTLLGDATYHCQIVRTYARKFDAAIKGINSPATREWHQVHADKHGQKKSPA